MVNATCFAVQLMDEHGKTFLPGVVEVECTSTDWGSVTAHTRFMHNRSLGMLGSRPVSAGEMPVIGVDEGVYITLGPYDANRKKFTGCKLEVHVGLDTSVDHIRDALSMSFDSKDGLEDVAKRGISQEMPSTGDLEELRACNECACSLDGTLEARPAPPQRHRSCRVFKWCIFT